MLHNNPDKKSTCGFNALQIFIFQLMESAYCDDVATCWKISGFFSPPGFVHVK